MARDYLKQATKTSATDAGDVSDTVRKILAEIESGGDDAALKYAAQFDRYEGNSIVTRAEIEAASAALGQQTRDDIQFAHDNIRRFAEKQKETIADMQTEIIPGLIAGQRAIPCRAAGCYVPGGRYAHVASALMTVTTAKVAGCGHIAVASPPRAGEGVHPAILYAADLCGADTILAMGGVQGVAAMAFGLFGLPQSDILVGPGNAFVAEAKRQLFGRVGIDMFAGPTDSLVLADETADPFVVAWDLVGQAEHGYNSPVWLCTTHRPLAEKVMELVPDMIASLPNLNADNAAQAWRDMAEVVVVPDREGLAAFADDTAPEHLTVLADDTDWFLNRLQCYGSLFLGEETTVAFGDKASGPNHVLPTSGAARYTGGLSVHKFMKLVTWQRATKDAARPIAEATARISRVEGMEGHARTADIRLEKFFPDQEFDLGKN